MQKPKPYFSGRGRMRTTSKSYREAAFVSVFLSFLARFARGARDRDGSKRTATSSFVKPLAAETVKRISQMRAIGD